MYNEKKCPKCGGNNPSNNNTCNHCGYSFSGRGGGVFTSKTKTSFKSLFPSSLVIKVISQIMVLVK